MKILKNCIKLSCSVRVYVPSTINVNQSFDSDEIVNETLHFLSKEFGGATASKALGGWISTGGELIKEPVTIVFSYATSAQLEDSMEKVYDYCLGLKSRLSQEAIALEINNELHLI